MSGISKLIIKSYGDDAFSSEKGEFAASINPANLKITSSLDYMTSQKMGTNSLTLRYNVSPPRVLSFKLLFDNSGIFPDANIKVKDQLDSLQSIIYNFQDDIKEPYYIRVIWGTIDFKGKLVGLETSYTLFQADGAPIRAEANISILEQVNPSFAAKSQQAQNASSSTDNSSASGSGSNGASNAGNASNNATNNTTNNVVAAGGSTTRDTSSSPDGSDTSEPNASESPNNTTSDTDPDAQSTNKTGENAKDPANEDGANKEASGDGAKKNDQQAPGDEASQPNGTNTGTKEIKQGDTLPAVANKSLGDPNLAKDLAKLNGLDSLRDLASGLKLAIPFSLAGLLAALLALLKKYGQKLLDLIKKKAQSAKEKAKEAKDKAKNKAGGAKDGAKGKFNQAKTKGGDFKDGAKGKFNQVKTKGVNVKDAGKGKFNQAKDKL